MEVKSVYLDLQEGVKKWNVWRLESEAFKDPIEIKIWYDNHELAEFNARCEWIESRLERNDVDVHNLYSNDKSNMLAHKEITDMLDDKQQQLDELKKQLQEKEKDIQSLLKLIADLKMVQDTHSWAILHLQDSTKQISQKITKQPIVIHDKWFISGHEPAGLWMINLPDWDYLLNAKYTVWEHNEYVTNKDDLVFDKIHVEWQHYVPFYKLEWGTELDVPTATIYYDLIFMPL